MKSLKIICPSRRRASTIAEGTLRLFPDAYVLVDEAERDDYKPVVKRHRLLTHPGLDSLSKIWNWTIDNVKADAIAFVGDDHTSFHAMPGWSSRRHDDPHEILEAIYSSAQCALDAGCALFGFAANTNPISYEPCRPIKLSRWITSPFGMIAGHGLRFDERMTLMLDVDMCLQSLLKHRIIWCDSRFALAGKALTNEGGSAHMRSEEAFAAERALLKEKWGQYIEFDTVAHHSSPRYKLGLPAQTLQTYVYVPRKQPGY